MKSIFTFSKQWEIADYFLALMVFTFPLYNKLMPSLLVLLGITLFYKRKKFSVFRSSFQWEKPSVWFVIFFFVHVVGLLYSVDVPEGVNDVGMKLSLLAMPIIINWVKLKINWNQLANVFLAGMVLACLVAFVYASYRAMLYVGDSNRAYFTESHFLFFMHRSYFAVYLAVAVIVSFERWVSSQKWYYIVFLVLFSIVIILSFSKAGILLYGLSFIPMLLYYVMKKYSWKRAFLWFVIIVGVGIGIGMSSTTLRVRFEKMIVAASGVKTENNTATESSESRMIMWATSFELFKENLLLGVGTGDVSQVITARNYEKGNVAVADKNLNSHNQYLNTAVQLGLLGLIPLLFIFVNAILYGVKTKSVVLILTSFVLGASMLFESCLERQDGVMPITLLILLFTLFSPRLNNFATNG